MEFEKWLYLTLIAACVAHLIGWAALLVCLSIQNKRDQKAHDRKKYAVFKILIDGEHESNKHMERVVNAVYGRKSGGKEHEARNKGGD